MSRVLVGLGIVTAAVAGCSSRGGGPALGAGTRNAGTPAAHVATTSSAASSAVSVSSAASSTASSAAAPGGGATAARDVCGLLSAAEASKLNNVHYAGTASRHIATGFDECTYDNTGNAPDPVDIQNLHVKVIAIPDCFAQLKTSDGIAGGHPVAGVGDEALGYSIGLLVRTGSTCVDITGLTHAELNGNWAPDAAMAKVILGRLH